MRRLAMLSLHTSPLAQPGVGDGGGMNVYVRELASALARAGAMCEVYTRSWSSDLPPVVDVEPGFRLHHIPAGPTRPLAKELLPGVVEAFTEQVLVRMAPGWEPPGAGWGRASRGLHGTGTELPFDAVHANYWLSGLAGHEIKHRLGLPLVSTFHTLDRVKAEAGPEELVADVPHRRAEAEAAVIRCSDTVLASCSVEAAQIAELYPAEPARVRVVPPGVDHACFAPGYRPQARRALGLEEDGHLLLFVGRLQPLKRPDLAVRTLASLARGGAGCADRDCRLLVVGGASGPDGDRTESEVTALAKELGLEDRVVRVPPQPHELLSTYYRAADVCLVPSHSESFGLVALEAAACGTPVVASAVGGLRTLVAHEETGLLVEDATPETFAEAARRVVRDPELAARLGTNSVIRSRSYTWRRAAHQLLDIYEELVAGRLVEC